MDFPTHALPAALIIMRNLPLALIGGVIGVLFSSGIPFGGLDDWLHYFVWNCRSQRDHAGVTYQTCTE